MSNRTKADSKQNENDNRSGGGGHSKKSPLRTQNDWSEHVSSKGFIYYYNCKTEVSQWQRPTEWTLPQMTGEEIKKCMQKGSANNSLKRNANETCVNESVEKRIKTEVKPTVERVQQQQHDDDMDISPGSSPLSGGSNSDCEAGKKNELIKKELTPHQVALVGALRGILNAMKLEGNVSVLAVSELLMRVDNSTPHTSYRLHRLHVATAAHTPATKAQPATLVLIKDATRALHSYLHDHHLSVCPPLALSPLHASSNLQNLVSLVETCLSQLCPQNLNSPSSTSSPGSLKDNSSNVSVSNSVTSAPSNENHRPESDNASIKREKLEEKTRSILLDASMLKYVSTDVTNTYRNAFADCCEKEAQNEYYKFVKLHSVLYSDLACESKKLKALVRISEMKTELLRQKKEDLEKLIQLLDSRRLPNHLRSDYYPSS